MTMHVASLLYTCMYKTLEFTVFKHNLPMQK